MADTWSFQVSPDGLLASYILGKKEEQKLKGHTIVCQVANCPQTPLGHTDDVNLSLLTQDIPTGRQNILKHACNMLLPVAITRDLVPTCRGRWPFNG